MAEEVEYDMNNIMLLEDKSIVKEEVEDHKIFVCESGLNISNNESKDYISNTETPQDVITTVENIKTEDGISYVGDLRTECDNGLLSCDQCLGEYEDYCVKCRMLVRILNRNVLSNTDSKAIEDIPKDILEFRDSFGHVGIFALKVIPAGVKFGPFTGLSAVECFCKIKSGRFSVTDDELKFLNWMQYINRARNISEQNLLILQCENEIFYRSIRQIYEGEELLMYFGEEYENSLNEDIEMCFIPPTDDDPGDVFACTFCCLGFNSAMNLAKHKRKVCSKGTDGIFSIEEIMQCPFCKMHMDEREYLEYHKDYCHDRNERKYIPLVLDNKVIEVKKEKGLRSRMFKCKQCNYETTCEAELKIHNNIAHCDVNHTKSQHLEEFKYNCASCQYKTNSDSNLENHLKTKHPKEFKFTCETCQYKTNHRICFNNHVKTKHLKEFKYKCELCEFKINYKSYLERHVKTKHHKEFDYECGKCAYKTNNKSQLECHVKTKHLNEFNYRCGACEFKTNSNLHLKFHVKTKHLKAFGYQCELCEFRSSYRTSLDVHVKTKHLRELNYKCETCEYRTSRKWDLERHAKTMHLKEFNYRCDACDYKASREVHLKNHVKTKHFKKFDYKCESCDFETCYKSSLDVHVKKTHLEEFNYKCDTCKYRTNRKWDLERHTTAKHCKEFNYNCHICEYKAACEMNLKNHVKSKHLKEFKFNCGICDFKTNRKSRLETHANTKHL